MNRAWWFGFFYFFKKTRARLNAFHNYQLHLVDTYLYLAASSLTHTYTRLSLRVSENRCVVGCRRRLRCGWMPQKKNCAKNTAQQMNPTEPIVYCPACAESGHVTEYCEFLRPLFISAKPWVCPTCEKWRFEMQGQYQLDVARCSRSFFRPRMNQFN